MVKTVPSSLQASASFPTNEEQKEKIVYHIAALNELAAGENVGAIISAKIVNHLPKE